MQREVWASQWRPAAGGQGSRTRGGLQQNGVPHDPPVIPFI